MANCCSASITLIRDEANPFTEEEHRDIAAKLAEIDHCDAGGVGASEETFIEWEGDTRWNIPTDHLVEIAKEFACKIRAIGREDGCAFVQVVCVDEDGNIVQDDEIGYAF